MIQIKIDDSGFLISINHKLIRTPTTIVCFENQVKYITTQLDSLGIKNYSIISKAPNKVADIFHKELVTIPEGFKLNYVRDNFDERDHTPPKLNSTILREIVSTNKVDYTSEMSPVKNQGSLGSCVGFATVAMKEWQEQQEHLKELSEGKKYKRKKKNYDLSEQWLYYKCKEIDYWPNEEGTSIRFAMKILNTVGVPCEKAWPYNQDAVGEPKRWANLVSRWALGGEYLRLNNPEEIINSLKNNGPLPIGVGCFLEIFYAGNDGMVEYPKDPGTCYGGHAICLVGWNPETRMFKFKNSWGTNWGEEGYGYLSYEYIKDFCWDAWEIKDLSVTKDMLKK